MLNFKRILTMSSVILALLAIGSATSGAAEKSRSYDLSVTTAVKLGAQVLNVGDYKITLEGSNAVFTKKSNSHNKTTFTVPAKLEAVNRRFDHTTMHLVMDAGQPRISSLELKGSKDLLRLE